MGAEKIHLGKTKSKLIFARIMIALFLALIIAAGFIAREIMFRKQEDVINAELSDISARLNSAMLEKKKLLEDAVEKTEKLLEKNATKDELAEYFYSETDKLAAQTDGEFLSVYCSNGEWQIMKDFTFPENYHPNERPWYLSALQSNGEIYVTTPYIDSRTGNYHYSMSKMTSDKKTVVSMDFSLEPLQKEIEAMSARFSGKFMIASESGVFYAHSDLENMGKPADSYSGYREIVQRAIAFTGEKIEISLEEKNYYLFSQKNASDWFIIACIDASLHSLFQSQSFFAIPLLVIIALFLFAGFAISIIISISISNSMASNRDNISLIRVRQNRFLSMLIIVFVIISAFFIYQGINMRISSEGESLKNIASRFEDKVSEWFFDAKNALQFIDYSMNETDEENIDFEEFSNTVAKVLDNSDIISNAYVYNPSWEMPLVDANGRHSEDMISENHKNAYESAISLRGEISLSAPYTDEKYKVYCVTINKAVYNKEGRFVCVASVECYLDKLVNILSAEQNNGSYAFLADGQTNIINHPYPAYQMRIDKVSKASELSYKSAFLTTSTAYIRDYDGRMRICITKTDEETGFFIVVVQNFNSINEKLSSTLIAFLSVLAFGIIMIVMITRMLSKWQISTAKELTETANLADQNSRAKADFLANMSHEIRTPMNAIVGMCELILREHDISETVRDYCFNIQNSGRSLLSIINDILDFSKIESGKMEIIEDEFNIASTLNDVINMAVTRKGDKKLELIIYVDPNIPMGLYGDEIRIRQIIINLVTNAIKYTNEGCVKIRVSQTKHDYGINLSISVEDTGIGITEENLEKLFSSFQQVDTKKNRSVEGTGLGLAISKRLITAMGGFINVSSQYGKGSEFRIVIPLKVTNDAPFISIKDADKIHAAGFIDFGKFNNETTREAYNLLIKELGDKLNTDIKLYDSMEKLKTAVLEEKFSHVFTAKEEYIKETDFFVNQAKKCEVVVVQDRAEAIDIPPELKCMYKPFYILSVASIFNHENVLTNISDRRDTITRFVAPQARILVVDDNAINLKVAVGLMRPYHMQVVTADSANAAISMLRSKDFHIVFMDHMMPEIDGVEATKIIRSKSDEYYQKLPIIALTANAVNGVRETFIASGMNDFIAKPIELSALDRALKTWLPKELIKSPSNSETTPAPAPKPAALPCATSEGNELFNSQTGIFYTGGDVSAYLEILDIYVKKGEGKRECIQKLFDEKDWKNYVIEVHALKSTSLTIGSKLLSERAKELELAGKSQNYKLIEEKNSALMDLYKQVIEIGGKFLEDNAQKADENADEAQFDKENLADISNEQLADIIAKIQKACAEFDGDEIAKICEEASGYKFNETALKPFFDEIKSSADDFEYDEAEQKAVKISEKLKGGEQNG